jgi:hypothetical protein
MAFGGFFKKKQDDFSDMDFSKKSPGDLPHLGLPADGDITNTSLTGTSSNPYGSSVGSNSSPYGEPQPSYGPSNPESFQKLGNLSMQDAAEQFTQQSSPRQTMMPMGGNSDSTDKLKMLDKDMQVINAKLDMLRSLIEGMNQRLSNIEKLADDSKKEEKIRW